MDRSIPPVRTLSLLFDDTSTCLQFLKNHGAFDIPGQCTVCGGSVALHDHSWRCKTKNCRKQGSFLTSSFFGQSRLPVNQVLEIGYYWLTKCSHQSIMRITGHSPNTVTDYMRHFSQLVACSLDREDTLIGGEGVEVQIDESKFGKRKYNRGHSVEGVWVIGGVEITNERRIFVETVEKRDFDTIVGVLSRHVLPGSTVVTDCWKGYAGIEEALSVFHLTVNHSVEFVDSESGACTNSIEGTWNGIKMTIPPRNRTKSLITEHLLEFIWRRKYETSLWEALINCFRLVGY
jgi:hypothetical protein